MHRIQVDIWMNFDIKNIIWGNLKGKLPTKEFIKWDFEWALSAYVFISCLIEVKPSENLSFCSNVFYKKSFLSQWKIVPESIWIQHYMYSYLAIFIPTHKFNFCDLYTLILIHRNVDTFQVCSTNCSTRSSNEYFNRVR